MGCFDMFRCGVPIDGRPALNNFLNVNPRKLHDAFMKRTNLPAPIERLAGGALLSRRGS
jgi:hypothetical protein